MQSYQCDHCAKSVLRFPSKVGSAVFCNHECSIAWRRSRPHRKPAAKNDSYRGSNWKAQQKVARDRDHGCCRRCGVRPTKPAIPVHHVRPYRLFKSYLDANQLDNLICLCNFCHPIEEARFWRESGEEFPPADFEPLGIVKPCRKCGRNFRSGSNALVCQECHHSNCLRCGVRFFSTRVSRREVKYCSVECRIAGRLPKPKSCVGCGQSFVNRKHNHVRFCSQACHLKADNPRRKYFARRASSAQASAPASA